MGCVQIDPDTSRLVLTDDVSGGAVLEFQPLIGCGLPVHDDRFSVFTAQIRGRFDRMGEVTEHHHLIVRPSYDVFEGVYAGSMECEGRIVLIGAFDESAGDLVHLDVSGSPRSEVHGAIVGQTGLEPLQLMDICAGRRRQRHIHVYILRIGHIITIVKACDEGIPPHDRHKGILVVCNRAAEIVLRYDIAVLPLRPCAPRMFLPVHTVECTVVEEEHLSVELLIVPASSASADGRPCEDRALLCVLCQFKAHLRAYAVVCSDAV